MSFFNFFESKSSSEEVFSKVPAVTFVFWLLKIASTTLGETAGDAVSMSLNWGYLLSTFLFFGIFLLFVFIQIRSDRFRPVLYWGTIIATTTLGTTLADFATRSLGIGYQGGSALLLFLLGASLFVWYKTMGSVSIDTIKSTRVELFYWVTIMFSQTLGTALGDWTSDSMGFGFGGAAILFSVAILGVLFLYYRTQISRTLLFWTAFILTRPFGAVLGDLLDKPHELGGLGLSRFIASFSLFAFIAFCLCVFPQKAAESGH